MSKTKRMKIGENFCFSNELSSIKDTQSALEYYRAHKQEPPEWLKLSNTIPLFLDTNVLLGMYKMSINERDVLLTFLEKNRLRVHLPAQVEIEFLRHRVAHIKAFKSKVENLISDYAGIKTEVLSWREKTSKRLREFSSSKMISGDLKQLTADFEQLCELFDDCKPTVGKEDRLREAAENVESKLQTAISATYGELDLEYSDPVLKVVAHANVLEKMDKSELEFLRQKYAELQAEYEKEKGGEKKYAYVFPGCGDIPKEKKDFDPCGDFYIYHEIISFMQREDTDVVLLTNDLTKEDWVKQDENPFLHYIVNAYQLTGHALYIVNANRYLAQSSAVMVSHEEDDIETIEEEGLQKINAQKSKTILSIPQLFSISSYFKDITEEQLLSQLRVRLQLSNEYHDGYVGENYFIYQVLGNQNYKYKSSKSVLDSLVTKGVVRRYTVDKEGHSFIALDINDLSEGTSMKE